MTHFDRRDIIKSAVSTLAAALSFRSASPELPAHAASPSQIVQASPFFDVHRFGAEGTGKTLDTDAINRAIAAAAEAGGGTVFFPAGTYLCFSIRLKSNVSLYLDQGCTVLAAQSPGKGETTGQLGGMYDAAEPTGQLWTDFGHAHWHNSLIWGEGLHDIAILGNGLIDGRGLSPGYGERDSKVFEQAGTGNKAIGLKNCRNVRLAGFSILKGGWFALLLTGIDNLIVDSLKIDTNRDGMDIDCCRNVVVSNCIVNAPSDDGICLKSSYALGFPRSTDNVVITNCIVSGGYVLGSMLDGTYKHFPPENKTKRNGRIKLGTESNGGFRNITISNCAFDTSYGLAIESVDGALCEDITITNITMRNLIAGPLFFRLGSRLRGPKDQTRTGTMRRILISNITSFDAAAEFPSMVSGIAGSPVEDVKISNVYCHHSGGGTPEMAAKVTPEDDRGYPDPFSFGPLPVQGFYLRHIRNLEMSHVEIAPAKPDARPSFYLQDVERADFYAVTAPKPGFSLNHVKDLRILLSRAAEDTVLDKVDLKTV